MADAEFDWLMKVDVGATLLQLKKIFTDCSARFSNTSPNNYSLVYQKIDTIKVRAKLDGFKITNADIIIKLASKHPILTCINECAEHPFPWRLYQIQDASNHLSQAIELISNALSSEFCDAEEVLYLMDELIKSLQKSRSSLLIPKRRNIDELQCSQNMQSIKPSLPIDFAISFYIQAHNLICSVYHLAQTNNGTQIKAEYQSEVSVPFLSEVLVFLSLGLQTCQQLKDKVTTLSCI